MPKFLNNNKKGLLQWVCPLVQSDIFFKLIFLLIYLFSNKPLINVLDKHVFVNS